MSDRNISAEAIAGKLEDAGLDSDSAREWLAEHDRQVKAETLREAADDPTLRLSGHSGVSVRGLRERAAKIEKETTMSTVDEAVEAGARALFAEERNEYVGDVPWPEYDSDDNAGRPIFEEHSRSAIAAAWPVLSAGLRRLHEASTAADYAGDCLCGLRYPCTTVRELDRIDRALGIGGES